jgi:hypothetical protein
MGQGFAAASAENIAGRTSDERVAKPPGTRMLTLVGIFMVVVAALLSSKEHRRGAWLLAAGVIILVVIADRMR